MAENLLYTQKGVEEAIHNFSSTGLIDTDVYLKDVLAKRLDQIKALREVILKKEREFFDSLAVTRPYKDTPKEAIRILERKVEEWNSSGANKLISNSSLNTILEILKSGDYQRLSTQEFYEITNNFMEENAETIKSELGEISNDALVRVLNEILEKEGQQKLPLKKRDTNGKSWIYFDIQEKDGRFDIQVKAEGFSSTTKSKLKKALKLYMEQHGKSSNEFSEAKKNIELLQRIILSGITNAQIRDAIKEQLSEQKIGGFNLAKDFNVIKGFLGEVYWSAFFSYLGATTIPTGDEKDITSGQSIAVDLLVGEYGFQVKNFNLKPDGKIHFGTRNQYKMAGTFITERARVDEELNTLLLLLYGSYAYNIDVSDGEFTDTREELQEILTTRASEIFTYYIDSIIRLDAQQENAMIKSTEDIIPNKKILFNTFFVIADKIIPSSAILSEIIATIDQSVNVPNISFEITGLKIDENSPKYDERVKSWNNKKMANYSRISYTIDFDINGILSRAYSNAIK